MQGFAIGNGLTDPAIQYKAYTDYALDMGIIKDSDHRRINKIMPVCELAIKLCGNTVLTLQHGHVCYFVIESFIYVNKACLRGKLEASLYFLKVFSC